MRSYVRWLVNHTRLVLLAAVLLTGAGAYFTTALYGNLRTNLEELLPSGARSVVDLKEINRRLESNANLGILVFSSHVDASKRFVDDLARSIRAGGGPLVARVEYRISKEIRFFERRQALFMSVDDLRRLRDFIRRRIRYEKELANPLNIFSGKNIPEPRIDLGPMDRRFSRQVAGFRRFPNGYYATQNQRIRAVLVYMRGDPSSIEHAIALRKRMDAIIARLDPRSYAPDLAIHYTGDVENLVEEHASLIRDLGFSAVVVFFLCSLAILFFFGNLAASAALVGSLVCGALWCFGVSYFAVGYLNANSAFLGSIVLGNGINFGIIVLARYMEERRHQVEHRLALETALTRTRIATLTAALAAGVAYASLMVTGFRGFRQFGLIGLIGMILCWASAFSVLPLSLELIHRRHPRWLQPRFKEGVLRGGISRWVAYAVDRFPLWIAGISALLAFLSAAAIASHRGRIIQNDTSKLRDKRSMTSGSGYYSRYLDEIFGRYISPMAILPRTEGQAREIRGRLARARRHSSFSDLLGGVYSQSDLIPLRQPEKIRILGQIRELLHGVAYGALSARDKKLVNPLLRPEARRPFSARDLPAPLRERFAEKGGAEGRVILVEPVFDPRRMSSGDNQARLINGLRKLVDQVGPGTPIAGQLPLTVDMYQAVRHDGPRATLLALIGVVLVVALLFRNLRLSLLALTALAFGVIWLAGAIFVADLKINFLNFIALPITFGIGVDYGVNVFQRYRIGLERSVVAVIRHTGGAVILASSTTMIGYASLLMAGNQAFVSFGRLAVIGELTCVSAAVLTLPAFLNLRAKRRALDQEDQEDQEAAERKQRGAA